MNKTDLIEHVAESADLSKADAARAVDAVIPAATPRPGTPSTSVLRKILHSRLARP
jgi:hypothetical protein